MHGPSGGVDRYQDERVCMFFLMSHFIYVHDFSLGSYSAARSWRSVQTYLRLKAFPVP